MPAVKPFPRPFRDEEEDDVESQCSEIGPSSGEMTPQTMPRWYRSDSSKRWAGCLKIREIGSRWRKDSDPERKTRRRRCCRWLWFAFGVLLVVGILAGVTYVALVAALIRRLDPPKTISGLQHIVENWKEPDADGAHKFDWRDDFSRDIIPKNCHSHNDYWRSVPLYQALAAGCVGIEADVWLNSDKELLVSHSWQSTKRERTLKSLYLDPLTNIFENRNVSVASTGDKEVGMFDADPNESTILLIDFKNDGHKIWPIVVEQLRPLREKGWLTYFDGQQIVKGPLTVVGTGNTPFDLVKENNTNRFIFFDAPLDDISNTAYTKENSYYASVQMSKAIGHLWFNHLTSSQVDTIKKQIKAATDKGLKSRYWSTPSWPISLRDKVWFTLTENDVGMLNVDELVSATRWNWNWCIIAGLNLCGRS